MVSIKTCRSTKTTTTSHSQDRPRRSGMTFVCSSPSLRVVAKIVAVIQVIRTATVVAIIAAFGLSEFKVLPYLTELGNVSSVYPAVFPDGASLGESETWKHEEPRPTDLRLSFLFLFIIFGLLLLVDIELWKGVSQRVVGKCLLWRCFCLIRFSFALFVISIGFYKPMVLWIRLCCIFEICIDVLGLLTLHPFINELSVGISKGCHCTNQIETKENSGAVNKSAC